MDEAIFTFTNGENHEQHQLVHDMEPAEATQLVSEGKAVKVDLSDYNGFRKQAEDAHSQYLKAKRAITESDNPYYQTPEVRKYELDKVDAEFKEQSEAIQSAWEVRRKELQQQAREKSARATVQVSQSDRTTAEQFADRLQLDLAQASNAAQLQETISKYASDVAYLSDSQKTALGARLPNVVKSAEAKAEAMHGSARTGELVSAVRNTKNMDLLSAKVAEQLPASATEEYRHVKIARGTRV